MIVHLFGKHILLNSSINLITKLKQVQSKRGIHPNLNFRFSTSCFSPCKSSAYSNLQPHALGFSLNFFDRTLLSLADTALTTAWRHRRQLVLSEPSCRSCSSYALTKLTTRIRIQTLGRFLVGFCGSLPDANVNPRCHCR